MTVPAQPITVTAGEHDAGKRLDAFLAERLPEWSRSRLQSWIKGGRVRVAGQIVRASHSVHASESFAVEPADLPPLKAQPEALPLTILYEDADVVVVDKPAGMVVHAGAGHHDGTLVNALLHHFGALSSVNGELRPGIVHRLDRETSGVLVVARTDRAHASLAGQFHDRQVKKTYQALVNGRFGSKGGRINSPITRDPVRRTRMTCSVGTGRTALTDYQVTEQFAHHALLNVTIHTGRTHQIRVHLASLKHPVVGDTLYGAPGVLPGQPPFTRFFLHAAHLQFQSPSGGDAIDVRSPLPPDFEGMLATIRALED